MAGVKVHLAKILATTDDDDVRDGAQAVQLAEQARQAIGDRDYRVFDALAAAYAASRRYDEACRAAQRSIELAEPQGGADVVRELQSRLALYRTGKAVRGNFGSARSALTKAQ